jgi:PAP2 superfamily
MASHILTFTNLLLSITLPVNSLATVLLIAPSPIGRSTVASNIDRTPNQAGVFTVGRSGKIAIDVLADRSPDLSQLGVFSLIGMNHMTVGSPAFRREALRRVAAGQGQGYLMFDDTTQGARFNDTVGATSFKDNSYAGVKTVNFQAGEQVALILIPKNSLSTTAPSSAKLSIDSPQLTKLSHNIFSWDDLASSQLTDRTFNNLVIKVTGAASNQSKIKQVITPRQLGQPLSDFASHSDVVLEWNKIALQTIKTDKTAPPIAAHNLAIMAIAVYDTVNGFNNFYQPYQVRLVVPRGASIEAAAATAAHRTLLEFYPQQKATLDTALDKSLQSLPKGLAVSEGMSYGQNVARAILAKRAKSRPRNTTAYVVASQIGKWQATSAVATPLLPYWSQVKPFALDSVRQFRPANAPTLASSSYAKQLIQTKELGAFHSNKRTANQTQIAKFWADDAGTYTPPGHWNEIAAQVLGQTNNTIIDNARTFALLNIATADAGIACWDAKYTYNTWRPLTAIHQADRDGNAETTADPSWQPLLITPPFPEYISGHSSFSSAAATILSRQIGSNINFSNTNITDPGVTRSFNNFQQAAAEAGMSRIYGGIHFMAANKEGLVLGKRIGNYVLANFLQPQ